MNEATNHNQTITAMYRHLEESEKANADLRRMVNRLERQLEEARAAA